MQRSVETQLMAQLLASFLQLVTLIRTQSLAACGSTEEQVHWITGCQVHDEEGYEGDSEQRWYRQQNSL